MGTGLPITGGCAASSTSCATGVAGTVDRLLTVLTEHRRRWVAVGVEGPGSATDAVTGG